MKFPKLSSLLESSNTGLDALISNIKDTYVYDDDALAVVDDFHSLVKSLSDKFKVSADQTAKALKDHFEELGVYVSGGHNAN